MSQKLESLSPLRQRLLFPLLILGLVFIFAFAVIGVTRRTSEAAAKSPSPGNLIAQNANREAKALLFTVQPYGFETAQIDVDEGRYLLVVQNRTGLDELLIRLEAEDGKKVDEEHAQRQQWRKRFDLKKGTYRLAVENNPEWVCWIRVN